VDSKQGKVMGRDG